VGTLLPSPKVVMCNKERYSRRKSMHWSFNNVIIIISMHYLASVGAENELGSLKGSRIVVSPLECGCHRSLSGHREVLEVVAQ